MHACVWLSVNTGPLRVRSEKAKESMKTVSLQQNEVFSVVTSHLLSATSHIRQSWFLSYVTSYTHQVRSDH